MSIWDKKDVDDKEGEEGESSTVGMYISLAIGVIATIILLVLGFADMSALGLEEPPQIIKFMGRFHPLVLHLPIGMITAVILIEFIALIPKYKDLRGAAHLLLWMTAFFGFFAAVFGDFWGLEDGPSEGLNEHQRMGTLAAVFMIWLVGISSLRLGENKKMPNGAYIVVLLFCMGWLSTAAHHGANLTHGETFLTKHLPPYLEFMRPVLGDSHDHDDHKGHDDHNHGEEGNGETPKNGEEGNGETLKNGEAANGGTEPVATTATYYQKNIHPIMMEYCEACHGDKKAKGKIKYNSFANMMKGDTAHLDEDGMIYTMELPLDDEYHMPPEDKPQPEKKHIELLKAWIAAGAKENEGPDPTKFGL